MGRYCDGEAAGFLALYALVAPRLYGYLRSLVGERAAAEDLLQHTMLKLHEARSAYVRGADPVPWLYAIAHRTALDELRRRARAHVTVTADGELPREPRADLAGDPLAADAAEVDRAGDEARGEATRSALAALEKLPANQREALVLTKLHGRSVAEAAAITGTTPGAIKLRAHRAYVTLRTLLARDAAKGER